MVCGGADLPNCFGRTERGTDSQDNSVNLAPVGGPSVNEGGDTIGDGSLIDLFGDDQELHELLSRDGSSRCSMGAFPYNP